MPPKANVGLLIPKAFLGPMPSPMEYTDFFQRADAMGFHSLWTTERILHKVNILDSVTALTWAAAVTQRIKLGSAVLLSTLRHPLVLARTVAGLDYVSNGRFILGLSLGGHPEELDAMDITVKGRPAKFEETVALLRKLWAEEEIDFKGQHLAMERVTVAPRPSLGGRRPILLGGAAEPVLRRAATIADGWIASSMVTPGQIWEHRQTLRTIANEVGRNPDSLEIGKLLYIAIDEDRFVAKERVGDSMKNYYGDWFDVDKFCAFGSPKTCADILQQYLDAGVTTLMIGLSHPDLKELELLHNEVLPLLR